MKVRASLIELASRSKENFAQTMMNIEQAKRFSIQIPSMTETNGKAQNVFNSNKDTDSDSNFDEDK